MPGIAGFATTRAFATGHTRKILKDVQALLTHDSRYLLDALTCSSQVCGTRVHAGVLQPAPQPYSHSGLSIWLDGEFYNREEIAQEFGIQVDTDLALLVALFKCADRRTAFGRIDGIYSAVIHDQPARKLHLLSDRHGLRPLFWASYGSKFMWASEVKAFLVLPKFEPVLNPQALEEFLGIGYLIKAHTWFKGIQRLAPATHLTYDLQDGSVKECRYWWWDRISPHPERVDEREAAEELGRRFTRAVELRSGAEDRVGIVLSGGLDSRAILAAMPERRLPISALTFGMAGSPDLRIARRVADLKGACHHIHAITAENWIAPRIEAVWWTDGLLNLLHMHGIEHLNDIKILFDVSLNGVGGGGLVGGVHLFAPEDFFAYTRHILGLDADRHPTLFESLREEFVRTGSAHSFCINHRIRSFSLHGPRTGTFKGVEYRLQFLDNGFQEMLYGLPLCLKMHNRIYRQMLLKAFPDYYRHIPWQSTGVPIAWPMWAIKASQAVQKVRRRIRPRSSESRNYTNYPTWIRCEPARSLFEALLLNSQALYPQYLSRSRVVHAWEMHLSGADRSEALGRFLTLELFLQQVFEGRWRTAQELG